MQLKRKLQKSEKITDEELGISLEEDSKTWEPDNDFDLPEFDVPVLDDDFTLDNSTEEWESLDSELKAEYEDYLAESYEPEIYELKTPQPEEVENSSTVKEKKTEKTTKSKGDNKMNLRDKLKKINDENNAVLKNIDEVLMETAKTQNCTTCVVTIDKVIDKNDYIYHYLEDNGLDIINLDVSESQSKVTVSWD